MNDLTHLSERMSGFRQIQSDRFTVINPVLQLNALMAMEPGAPPVVGPKYPIRGGVVKPACSSGERVGSNNVPFDNMLDATQTKDGVGREVLS